MGFSTQYDSLEIHPRCCVYPECTPSFGCMVSHGVGALRFTEWFPWGRTFGSFLILDYCKHSCYWHSCTGFWVNRSFSLSGGKCPQIQLLGSIVSIFHFVRSHHNFFFSEWLYQFTFQPVSDRVSPHLHQHLVLSLCFILAILIVG